MASASSHGSASTISNRSPPLASSKKESSRIMRRPASDRGSLIVHFPSWASASGGSAPRAGACALCALCTQAAESSRLGASGASHGVCTGAPCPSSIGQANFSAKGHGRAGVGAEEIAPGGRPGVRSTRWPPCPFLVRGQAEALVNRRVFLGTLAGGLLAAPLAGGPFPEKHDGDSPIAQWGNGRRTIAADDCHAPGALRRRLLRVLC